MMRLAEINKQYNELVREFAKQAEALDNPDAAQLATLSAEQLAARSAEQLATLSKVFLNAMVYKKQSLEEKGLKADGIYADQAQDPKAELLALTRIFASDFRRVSPDASQKSEMKGFSRLGKQAWLIDSNEEIIAWMGENHESSAVRAIETGLNTLGVTVLLPPAQQAA